MDINQEEQGKNVSTFEVEVQKGQRFKFGENWQSFLSILTDERIKVAEKSLVEMLRVDNLNDRTFLDIGSGSGLLSLVARNLGAEVHSFDFDPASVACTQELRSRYFPNDPKWIVQEGSILDKDFVNSLGSFDVVYSWGVLHHTGDMWTALENATSLVNNDGTLFIAIYNDQGMKSKLWRKVKNAYCSGVLGRIIVSCIFFPYFFSRMLISCVIRRKNMFAEYRKRRGMSITHDWSDWLGGLPFEVAKVEEIFHFGQAKGFVLKNIATATGLGNNQFVFARESNG